jgi:hypothetical protein
MRKNKKTISVSYGSGVNNEPAEFTGTVRQNKRKSVLKVSNPTYGTVKKVEKISKRGGVKTKTVDKFPTGKKVVTKTKVKPSRRKDIEKSTGLEYEPKVRRRHMKE